MTRKCRYPVVPASPDSLSGTRNGAREALVARTDHRDGKPVVHRMIEDKPACGSKVVKPEATIMCPTCYPHRWIGASTMPIPRNIVQQASQRGVVTLVGKVRVSVLEVYCDRCNSSYDDVVGKACSPSREHLIGGPIKSRRKRTEGPTDEDDLPQVSTG